MVPETKGRTLEEMDELFGEVGFAQADRARKERIEREIGLTGLLEGDDAGACVSGKAMSEDKHGSQSDSDGNAEFVEGKKG